MKKLIIPLIFILISGCTGSPPKPTPVDFSSKQVNLINGEFPAAQGEKKIIPTSGNQVWKYSINSRSNTNTNSIEFYYALGNANKIYINTKTQGRFENSKQALTGMGTTANIIWVSQPNFPENYTQIDFVRDLNNEK